MNIFTAKDCANTLLSKERILILVHSNPDGDCIGSGIALAEILISLGKTVRVVCPHTLPERLGFAAEGIAQEVLCFGQAPEDNFTADIIVSTDVASPELLGRIRENYDGKINLCIDHHMINTMSADAIWRDASAAACGEMILELCDEMSEITGRRLLTESVANRLYIAISSDSGSFKYGNTTAKTLLYASRLKSVGADSEVISRLLFETKTLAQFRLTGLCIPKTEFFCDGKLAFCLLLDSELAPCGATKEDCDGITQIFREVKGVELSIFAKQHTDSVTGENCIKMSLRSNTFANCAAVCETFGGGGHIKAAGCTIRGKDNETAKKMIIERAIEELCNR